MKVAHSNNITDEGVRTGSYAAQTTLDTVQIEGAAKLQVDVWFNLYNNSNYGYLSIYDGTMTPSPSNASTANVSNGRLYGNTAPFREKPADDNAQRHKTYIVNGDTVQFLFYSNIARDYYGYWAEIKALNSDETPYTYSWNTTFTEITGSYERPNVALEGYGFAGWYTDDTNQTTEFEMTGENSSSTGRVPIGDLSTVETGGDGVVDVYAKYDIVSLMQVIFFNAKLKTIANNTNKEYTQDDQKVEAIKWSSYEPTAENRTEDHIVSVATSPYPVYAWFDDSNGTGTIYLWCATNTVFTPPTFSYAFSDFRQLQDISGLANLNTSRTTALDHAFEQCQKLENLNGLQNWDVSNVMTMQSTFDSCRGLTTLGNPESSVVAERGISDWRDRLDSLTSMYGMFSGCQNLTEVNALKDWDVSNVTRMEYMLSSYIKLTNISGLSRWNTGRVTSLASTFSGCSMLSDLSPLSGWNTSSVTSLNNTFSGCKSLVNLNDISEWNTEKVTNMNYMFQNCSGLTNVDGLANWNTGNVTNMQSMFNSCRGLTNLDGLASWNTGNVTSMSYMFYNCIGLTNVDGLVTWNTGKVTDMSCMFQNCSGLTNLNSLTNWNTGKVMNMYYMFYNCSGLTNLEAIANWNTGNVINMSYMFSGCNDLTNVNGLANWNTGKVTNMGYMFQNCSGLTNLNGLANWNTENITNMDHMFYNCSGLTNLEAIASWNTGKVTNMGYMFQNCSGFTNLNGLANWNTGNVTNMTGMFRGCSGLTDATGINSWADKIANCTSFANMFYNANSQHPDWSSVYPNGTWDGNGTFKKN